MLRSSCAPGMLWPSLPPGLEDNLDPTLSVPRLTREIKAWSKQSPLAKGLLAL